MLRAFLANQENKKALYTEDRYGDEILVTTGLKNIRGTFKAAVRSSAGTTIIVDPIDTNAIVLTDLIWSTTKANGATTTVRFTDGSNTINIITLDNTDNALTGAISFAGRWEGWQGARLELVTTGVTAVTATVSVGYFKVKEKYADTWEAWDAKR